MTRKFGQTSIFITIYNKQLNLAALVLERLSGRYLKSREILQAINYSVETLSIPGSNT